MSKNPILPKDVITKDDSSHVAGTPTLTELRLRVSMRQEAAQKKKTKAERVKKFQSK